MNYIGSKYSLINFLTETIETIVGHKNNKKNYTFIILKSYKKR